MRRFVNNDFKVKNDMATWSISPNDGGASITNGVATFPKNTGTTNIEYTITYIDDNGCSGETKYTIPSGSTCQGGECGCSALGLNKTSVSLESGEDSSSVGVTFNGSTVDLCNYSVEVESGSEWLSADKYEHEITVSATKNTSASSRVGKVRVYVEGTKCDDVITVTQEGSVTDVTYSVWIEYDGWNTDDYNPYKVYLSRDNLEDNSQVYVSILIDFYNCGQGGAAGASYSSEELELGLSPGEASTSTSTLIPPIKATNCSPSVFGMDVRLRCCFSDDSGNYSDSLPKEQTENGFHRILSYREYDYHSGY